MHLGSGHGAVNLIAVDEALPAVGGFGGQRVLGQDGEHLGRQGKRVD